MSGVALLVIIGLWLWLAFKLSKLLGRRIAGERWGLPLEVLLLVVLLPLPVMDEIVGGFQFRKLCEQRASRFSVEVAKPEGRVTRYSSGPLNTEVPGASLTILRTDVVYTDVSTNEVVVRFTRYLVKGGALVRALGISQNGAPLTIGHPSCSPEQARGEVASRTYKFSVIN